MNLNDVMEWDSTLLIVFSVILLYELRNAMTFFFPKNVTFYQDTFISRCKLSM